MDNIQLSIYCPIEKAVAMTANALTFPITSVKGGWAKGLEVEYYLSKE